MDVFKTRSLLAALKQLILLRTKLLGMTVKLQFCFFSMTLATTKYTYFEVFGI